MKLAFSSLPFTGCSRNEIEIICKKYSLACEVRSESDGSFLMGDFPLCDVGTSICLKSGDAIEEEKFLPIVQKLSENGVSALRVFLGNFTQRWDSQKEPINVGGIIKLLLKMCEIGPEIWIETHNEFARGIDLLPILTRANHPKLGVIWDILHPIEDKEDYQITWELLKPYIRHIHIKDAKPNPDSNFHDWYYTKLGEGVLPIKEIVRLVLKDGYDGYFSLEWESMWRAELKEYYPDKTELLLDYIKYMENIL